MADNLLNIAPIGTIITELITTTIPSRRMENVVLMLEIFGDKVKYIDKDVLELKMKTKEFEDLIQDGFIQTSRALSKERLEYIASLLKNSLTDEELEHLVKKKLLSYLGELDDVEIIWLKYYSLLTHFQDSEFQAFYKKHENILTPEGADFTSSEDVLDRDAMKDSYKNNLLRLGLIDGRNELIDSQRVVYYCTRLGKMLLRYIDFENSKSDK